MLVRLVVAAGRRPAGAVRAGCITVMRIATVAAAASLQANAAAFSFTILAAARTGPASVFNCTSTGSFALK
jgi:hypothetical protein